MTNEERRKAAEWFRNRAKNCPMQGARRMYEIATEALEERERNEQPHWIPVTERLPETKEIVQITDGINVGHGYLDGTWHSPFCDIDVEHISHWMNLPEPPKESET